MAVLSRTLILASVLPMLAVCSSSKVAFMVDEEDREFDGTPSLSHEKSDDSLCGIHSICTPIKSCTLLQDLMEQSCLATEKLGELTCGYQGDEILVCCPRGGLEIPLTHHYTSTQGSSLSQKRTNCGQPLFNNMKEGRSGGLGSHPWVARIGYKNTKTGHMSYPCCGSIISDKTILTAAHCALGNADNYKLTSVRVGEYDSKGDPDCTKTFCAHPVQDIPVSHIIVHPGFERKVYKHDVALLVLKAPMNFSVAALPTCLLENPNVPLVGRRAALVGWGKIAGQEVTPSREQLLELPILPLDECSKVYGGVALVTQNQLCVGGEAGKDACSGFGGAPLILLDHYTRSRYYQVGIVSFGSDKCGTAGVPSVYSSVHHYAEWIRKNMV